MRYLISILFICAFAVIGKSQVQYREGFMEDTLTNTETAYLYPGDAATAAAAIDFKEFGALEVTLVVDSLSGSTGGTVTLEGCYDDACAYVATIASVTANGATEQVSTTEDSEFVFRKFRVKNVMSGTQSTRVRCFYTWKRKT